VTRELVKQKFGQVWPAHVASFVDLLIEGRRAVGDLDLLLVLSVIGDRNMSQRRTAGERTHQELFEHWSGRPEPEEINSQSIAHYTGIPRETVRRKVNDLVMRGWVERRDGALVVTRKCAEDLSPMTEKGIDYLSNMFRLLDAMRAE